MASYTMQLRTYIEMFSQYDKNLSTNEKIEIARSKLFDFEYPIFDKNYKKILETNIIRKFYFREIGFETEGMFKFYLESFMQLNMPYFNRLFESEMIKYDPLINSEMNVTHNMKKDIDREDKRRSTQDSKTTGESTGKDSGKTSSKAEGFDRSIESDTPDSRLRLTTNPDGTGVIEYASRIKEDTNKASGSGTSSSDSSIKSKADNTSLANDNLDSNINEIEDFIQYRQGKIGVQTYSKMVMEYRQSFLRIEKQIHQELQNLFMLVY